MLSCLRLVIAAVLVQSLPSMIGQQIPKDGSALQRRYVAGSVSTYQVDRILAKKNAMSAGPS
jgi:hypothetical protein